MSVLAEAVEVERVERERPMREARAEVERARLADERVTERELLTACGRAVKVACGALSHDEREDLAAHLAEAVARKAGSLNESTSFYDWTPPRRMVAHSYLTRRAAYLWARERERLIAGRSDARPSMLDQSRMPDAHSLNANGTLEGEADAPETTGAPVRSVLAAAASAAGHPAPAPENVDASHVCAALGVSATAADAITAAMSGWGSAIDMARALNVSHEAARARLSRGRAAIRRAYPDPRALIDALQGVLADAPDPERVAERVRLGSVERAAQDALTAVKRSGRQHVRMSDPQVTIRAARRNWRGYLRPVLRPADAPSTYSGRRWVEPQTAAAPIPRKLTRGDLIMGGWIVPAS